MSIAFFKKPVVWLGVASAIIVLIAGGLWWANWYTGPERVFWGMVEQSLKTRGVTMQAEQDQGGTVTRQTMQYSLGATNIAHSYTVLQQGKTKVVTELIGTPTANYNRYVTIETDEKDAEGKPLDLSKVKNVWAKANIDGSNPQAAPSLLSQAVFGFGSPVGGAPVPTGNLTPEARQDLLSYMKQQRLYQTKFGEAKRQKIDGRTVYIYKVTMPPQAYVGAMKRFAKSLGLHDLDALDPSQYAQSTPLQITFTVDVRSRHLIKATFETDKASQTYRGYDIAVETTLPAKTITAEELQKRLSELR